jgi:serine/threonine protein kinase
MLRDGRYRLQDLLERQDWQAGVFEAIWNGRDLRRGGVPVTICEVVVPELAMLSKHANLASATRALASSGRDPHIAALLEAFSDQGRSFFVFEMVEGDTLLTHLRRLGRPLPEAEVVELCWQLCETLDLLSRQSPPLTHGLIRPEHIYVQRNGGHYTLANFSPLVVIGASALISGGDRARLSPYTPPDFPGARIDVRSDLYSLLATAYHAITGNAPLPTNMTIPRARQLNPAISVRLDAILARGLHPVPQQRYQTPFELRQDLLALRTGEGQMRRERSAPLGTAHERPPMTRMTADEPAFALPMQIAPLPPDPLKVASALPDAEELPPLKEGGHYVAYLESAVILASLFIIAVLSHYHG